MKIKDTVSYNILTKIFAVLLLYRAIIVNFKSLSRLKKFSNSDRCFSCCCSCFFFSSLLLMCHFCLQHPHNHILFTKIKSLFRCLKYVIYITVCTSILPFNHDHNMRSSTTSNYNSPQISSHLISDDWRFKTTRTI